MITIPTNQTAFLAGALDADGTKQLTIDEALEMAGLDWEVRKVPLTAEFQGKPVTVEGRWGVQNEKTGEIYGTVGRAWHPTQNRAGFTIVDDLLRIAGSEGKPAHIVHAMPLMGGKKVIVTVELGQELQIAGEDYKSYLSFVNGHDGRTSVMALAHDVRYVCQNGQIGALMGDNAKNANIVRVRHTRHAGTRIKEAIQILGMRQKALEELAKQGEWLVDQPMPDAEFERFLNSLFPQTADPYDSPAKTMAMARRDKIAVVYAGAQNLDPIRGTRWGALQATIEYADHMRDFKNSDTAVMSQIGLGQVPVKEAAFRILADKKMRPVKDLPSRIAIPA